MLHKKPDLSLCEKPDRGNPKKSFSVSLCVRVDVCPSAAESVWHFCCEGSMLLVGLWPAQSLLC